MTHSAINSNSSIANFADLRNEAHYNIGRVKVSVQYTDIPIKFYGPELMVVRSKLFTWG